MRTSRVASLPNRAQSVYPQETLWIKVVFPINARLVYNRFPILARHPGIIADRPSIRSIRNTPNQYNQIMRPMENPFASCWDRINRLEIHRLELATIWNGYLDQDPFGVSLINSGDGQYLLQIYQNVPVPTEFSLVFGEWLYHARACLDYIIWATSSCESGRVPPPNEGNLSYPIFDEESKWTSWKKKNFVLQDHQIEMLFRTQPFNGDLDASYLRAINRLARIDRHRRLTVGTAVLAQVAPIVEALDSSVVTVQWGSRLFINGVCELARIQIEPFDPSLTPRVNPDVTIDPEIEEWQESKFWRGVSFGERLEKIQLFIAGEVAVYEYDCLGSSRNTHLLTPEFKKQSDERGHRGKPQYDARPAVKWGEPISATRTTPDEFFRTDTSTIAEIHPPHR